MSRYDDIVTHSHQSASDFLTTGADRARNLIASLADIMITAGLPTPCKCEPVSWCPSNMPLFASTFSSLCFEYFRLFSLLFAYCLLPL